MIPAKRPGSTQEEQPRTASEQSAAHDSVCSQGNQLCVSDRCCQETNPGPAGESKKVAQNIGYVNAFARNATCLSANDRSLYRRQIRPISGHQPRIWRLAASASCWQPWPPSWGAALHLNGSLRSTQHEDKRLRNPGEGAAAPLQQLPLPGGACCTISPQPRMQMALSAAHRCLRSSSSAGPATTPSWWQW